MLSDNIVLDIIEYIAIFLGLIFMYIGSKLIDNPEKKKTGYALIIVGFIIWIVGGISKYNRIM
jgi:hypothetical protein